MKIKHSFIALFVSIFFAPLFVSAATCINLTTNLSQGMTDATTGGQVSVLQSYLVSAGYLSAKPNGVFGPATFAAVKSFQSANSISTTGSVVVMTRAAISIKSCLGSTAQITTPVVTTPTSANPSSTVAPVITTAPTTGQTLGLGDTFTIKWTGPSNINYSVVLEDSNGVAQGFITAGSYANQYLWQVGNVNNSNSGQMSVPPGTYRVHVEDASVGPQSSDKPSGTFTISSNMNISQIFPRTVPADGNTTVIIYGAGFNSNSMVYIYGYGNTGVHYVSPDGRAIAFTIPTGTYPGAHAVSVINAYGTENVNVESNQTSITVINP